MSGSVDVVINLLEDDGEDRERSGARKRRKISGGRSKEGREDKTWVCKMCTLINGDHDSECVACGNPSRRRQNRTDVSITWACAFCTFVNDPERDACEMCRSDRRKERSRTIEEPSNDVLAFLDRDLRVLTWNLAMCESSFSAPLEWTATKQIEKIVACVKAFDPDVVALQEVPENAGPLLRRLKYVDLKTGVSSHCGYVKLLLHPRFRNNVRACASVGPAVVARVEMTKDRHVYLASMHLSPGKTNASRRLLEMRRVLEWCRDEFDDSKVPNERRWVLCGDMNMRRSEDAAIENLPSLVLSSKVAAKKRAPAVGDKDMSSPSKLILRDAWKAAGKPKEARFTWNSYMNKYHEDAFAFTCRFDRIYTLYQGDDEETAVGKSDGTLEKKKPSSGRNDAGSPQQQQQQQQIMGTRVPSKFVLVGHRPCSNRETHFLSDHFGLTATFSLF